MRKYPELTENERINKTIIPMDKKIKLILDTDPGNEIDDQFAIAYAMLAKDRINLLAIHAEQYRNTPESLEGYKSNTPEDSVNMFRNATSHCPAKGVEISYEQASKVVKILGADPKNFVYMGCNDVLKSEDEYIDSDAVNNLIQCAMKCDYEDPLYIVNIGANTNTASAIIKEPEIIKKIIVISLCGNTFEWPDNNEFNYFQDPIAAKVIFDSGVPLIQMPGKGVSGYLRISIPEIEVYMGDSNPICEHLFNAVKKYTLGKDVWSKPLWDIATIAMLINPNWAPTVIDHSPIMVSRTRYAFDPRRHLIRRVCDLNRDKIYADMFKRLKEAKFN